MIQSYPLKNLPTPLQVFVRPMLLISLALHGILLFIPLPSKPKATEAKPEKSVKITQLSNSSSQRLSKPSPKSSAKRVQTPKVIKKGTQQNRQPILLASRPKTITPPQSVQTAQPKPAPSAIASPSSPNIGDPFADFPHYSPITPGCFGLPSCYKTGATLANVSNYFEQQLPAKYKVEPGPSEAGRKVYKLTKGGKTQYLSLMFTDEQEGTVYVLADEPRSIGDLKKAIEVPSWFSDVIANLDGEPAEDSAYFADPSRFFSKVTTQDADGSVIAGQTLQGIYGTPKLIADQKPEAVYASLTPKLQPLFDSVSRGQDYSGGPVYELKKGNFTGYLNLVPTKDGKGTIVVLWTSQPQ